MKVGDRPKVCWTALVASSETIRRTVSANSASSGSPHSVNVLATCLRAEETEAGSLAA